ncbi:MAG: sigma-70 region 4 domain-containing protein, partial [Micrococcales bacterium]|nr:sigma-70 region 4 domain-containing protein [Micrococcales bacterium]
PRGERGDRAAEHLGGLGRRQPRPDGQGHRLALPPAEGEAMALTVWAGLTPTEAAEVLGCSVTALTSRLSRARARLGAVLAADDPDGADLGTPDRTTTDRTTTDRTTTDRTTRTAGTVSPGRADQERRGR